MTTRSARASKKRPPARKPRPRAKASRTALPNIRRREKSPKDAAGWSVSLTRRGEKMFKSFADSKHGGKTKALKLAKAWRERMLKSTSDVEYVLWRREKRSRPSGSGIVGVGRYTVHYAGRPHEVWEAAWKDADGKRHSRRFFISVYGERRAKALARAARDQAIEDLRHELMRRGRIFE
jgi:hypothetical protein